MWCANMSSVCWFRIMSVCLWIHGCSVVVLHECSLVLATCLWCLWCCIPLRSLSILCERLSHKRAGPGRGTCWEFGSSDGWLSQLWVGGCQLHPCNLDLCVFLDLSSLNSEHTKRVRCVCYSIFILSKLFITIKLIIIIIIIIIILIIIIITITIILSNDNNNNNNTK